MRKIAKYMKKEVKIDLLKGYPLVRAIASTVASKK